MFKTIQLAKTPLYFSRCNQLQRFYGKVNFLIIINLLDYLIKILATRKRFYRKTSILESNGKYEITLDQRKLKTPKGNLFVVDNESLALAIATEWDAQKDKIVQSSMHLVRHTYCLFDNKFKY